MLIALWYLLRQWDFLDERNHWGLDICTLHSPCNVYGIWPKNHTLLRAVKRCITWRKCSLGWQELFVYSAKCGTYKLFGPVTFSFSPIITLASFVLVSVIQKLNISSLSTCVHYLLFGDRCQLFGKFWLNFWPAETNYTPESEVCPAAFDWGPISRSGREKSPICLEKHVFAYVRLHWELRQKESIVGLKLNYPRDPLSFAL